MVSKKTLKEYDFNDIEDYYNYIIESNTNGQRKQFTNLVKKLNKEQLVNFVNYLETQTSDRITSYLVLRAYFNI